jgi:hypothetical protein
MFGQPGKVGRDPVIIRSTTPILHRREKGYSLSTLLDLVSNAPELYHPLL